MKRWNQERLINQEKVVLAQLKLDTRSVSVSKEATGGLQRLSLATQKSNSEPQSGA